MAACAPPPIRAWDESRVEDSDEEVVIKQNWTEIRRFMWNYVGIVRTTKRLERAQHRIRMLTDEVNDYYGHFRVTPDLIELRNLLQTAELIVRCALHRKESRGLHYTLDYLETLDEAIEPSGLQGLDQIIIHKPYFSSENLFGNDLMPKILEELSGRYDTIILDLPPLVGLADGRFLAALADAVTLVIRWNKTPKHAVTSATQWLKSDGANLVGSMFTMVDTNSQAVGSYYYYSKQYSEYYQEA